jgi:hypothetical protein
MEICIDSNILIHAFNEGSSYHSIAIDVIEQIIKNIIYIFVIYH